MTSITPERLEAAGWKLVPEGDNELAFVEIWCGIATLAYYWKGGGLVAESAWGDECLLGKPRTMEKLAAVVDAIRGLHEEKNQ